MKNCTRELRMAFISQLQPLQWRGATIPIRSGMLDSNPGRPAINGLKFDAMINVINEFRLRNTAKKTESHKNSLTLDIVTSFSGESYNFAGQEWVEELADIVYGKLFNKEIFKIKSISNVGDIFTITSCEVYSQPMPLQYTDTSRVFRVVIIFEIGVQHTEVDANAQFNVITI